ncbi:hypothetical protein CAPTEDRAFT_89789 [Capitella teleta]|uniref:tRNA dimethylallyltransferase n=1 Tax=Capitella teleta TaxID=283909 RepID=R7TBC8_CAPTE|nr:hypothetical protein CAPTEDRAFT_89789 [Capitella teleta]|eukprot:ELT88314.1 hypothetical protein CAPTEDRAFT_89789 [Capitella teleta]
MAASLKITRQLPLVVVLGATGAGKSKLAIELAKKFKGEIISADSMQVYKSLDIVTNKVSAEEQRICPHHLLDVVSPLQRFNVIDFRDAALDAISRIHSRQNVPIIVGGTNYYIEALLWKNLVAKSSAELRTDASCSDDISKWTTPRIYDKLLEVDPMTAKRYHPHDRRKLLRALEVYFMEGRTLSDVLTEQHSEEGGGPLSGPLRFPEPCIIWVQCEKEVLNDRTDKRVDEMVEMGLLREMLDFHVDYNVNHIREDGEYTLGIFQSIGFKEFHQYLILSDEERDSEAGKEMLLKGIEDMKRATRRYARRQQSWMNNRFLRRVGPNVPPIYGVDSTIPSDWMTQVHEPACSIVKAYLMVI